MGSANLTVVPYLFKCEFIKEQKKMGTNSNVFRIRTNWKAQTYGIIFLKIELSSRNTIDCVAN